MQQDTSRSHLLFERSLPLSRHELPAEKVLLNTAEAHAGYVQDGSEESSQITANSTSRTRR